MESFYSSKYGHGQGFYQNPNQNLRQTDYNFVQGTRRSTLLWRDYPNHGSEKKRDKTCTIALAVSSFFVLVAVFGVAGLAVYMNTIQPENTLVTYACSAKILRGERFISNLPEKTRRYAGQLETLLKRGPLGAAFASCQVDSFGDDGLTMNFRVTFHRKKLPKSGVERIVRDALLNDVVSSRPVFRNVRFDPKNVSVRKVGVGVEKSNQRSSVKAKESRREDAVKDEEKVKDKSPALGSFTISKTEADITEKKTVGEKQQQQQQQRPKLPVRTTLKTTTTEVTTVTSTTTTTTTTTTIKPSLSADAPWIPIKPGESSTTTTEDSLPDKQPTYTSFTNPGLSFHIRNMEILGTAGVKSHPIPVNKIAEITTQRVPSFVEIETIKQPTTRRDDEGQVLKNISLLFHNLASSLGIGTTTEQITLGQGQAEVIEGDEESLIMQTSKVPLITLLPAKSHVSGTLRPRPKPVIENRSFPNEQAPFAEHKIVAFVSFAKDSSEIEAPEKRKLLTSEEISKLSEISNVSRNESVISTKAVSSGVNVNHDGFKLLTKTLNKFETEKKSSNSSDRSLHTCNNSTVTCGDGQCLPSTTRCNQLIECKDAADEKGCQCADYLQSQFLVRKICDGIVDCWDFSDENRCDWCKTGQYVCSNSKVCIDRMRICDGIRDCPLGDDEKQCVTIAPNLKAAEEFPYNTEGYLMVRKKGEWGKLCVDSESSKKDLDVMDLGRAVCKALTYQNVTYVERINNTKSSEDRHYKLLLQSELKFGLQFKEANCNESETVKVRCESLECGARPQAVKHIARIVGGGNAALGAWPWQAALYKEGEFQCGATLLSDRWLLSAGHCFFHSLEEHWVARLGALRRGAILPSPYEQLRSIVRIVIHPGYVDAGFVNDISLLKMDAPIVFSDYVRPICLPQAKSAPVDGALCTVVGWGQLFEAGRIFPDTLQEVQVPVISTAECRKRTIFLPLYSVTEDMFCAGFERGGRDACLGDSGGPLMCPENDGRWVLHGVTSNGYGCARANRPGVYTKVANYVSWIYDHMDLDDFNFDISRSNTCQGHRCPLGECLPKSRLCNGFIECSDGSDERDCN